MRSVFLFEADVDDVRARLDCLSHAVRHTCGENYDEGRVLID